MTQIILVSNTSFNRFIAAWNTQEKINHFDETMEWMIERVYLGNRFTYGNKEPHFIGTPTSMEFYAPLPQAISTGGIYRIKIYFSTSTSQMIINWKDPEIDSPFSNDLYENSKQTLVFWDGVKKAEFSYLNYTSIENDHNAETEWLQWTSSQEILAPRAIILRVLLKGESRQKTSIYTPLLFAQDNCKFDIISRKCRLE